MLIGQRVPTEYTFEMTAADTSEYEQYRAKIRADLGNAVPVRQALQVATSTATLV